MKAETKNNVFYALPVFLLVSACLWIGSSSKTDATLVPSPSATVTAGTIVASKQPASPTVVAGSFADFQLFATEIAAALQGKNVSFFDRYVAPSVWTCLGDETVGVCKDIPANTPVEGIPVSYDWARYELPSAENYKAMWQTTYANHDAVKLVAIAHLFGDNPIMPLAGQSFLAIVAVADNSDPVSIREARVLFFEHNENTWHLRGELVASENAEAWINNTCDRCYDTWTDWQE